jgi:hypothetical protein
MFKMHRFLLLITRNSGQAIGHLVRVICYSRKVANSIYDDASRLPSSLTMALGLNRLLTEISTRNLSRVGGRGGGKRSQPHRHLSADCLESVKS